MTPIFEGWPKIARLNRDIIITEKLDGTNAAIGIVPKEEALARVKAENVLLSTDDLVVYAQSRTRIITPENDNMGFAAWVKENEAALKFLGPGLHFGEWWGQKIQRGYGLRHRVFSLFNTRRWVDKPEWADVIRKLKETGLNIDVVPILYTGPRLMPQGIGKEGEKFYEPRDAAQFAIQKLNLLGSVAVPGFMDPEGIVIFHTAAQTAFKVMCAGDEKPKGQV